MFGMMPPIGGFGFGYGMGSPFGGIGVGSPLGLMGGLGGGLGGGNPLLQLLGGLLSIALIMKLLQAIMGGQQGPQGQFGQPHGCCCSCRQNPGFGGIQPLAAAGVGGPGLSAFAFAGVFRGTTGGFLGL
ncbi:MAG TPA: hypothetical protein VNO81_06610 [Candidatus Nitrosotenuis sp.]|jgi:hypothetical protein|nr:hypothetical protein [Candidatus Nitrosotenuis sp.]